MTDFYSSVADSHDAFGRAGVEITPDDNTDLDVFAKTLVVSSVGGGDVVQFLPVDNADGAWLTMTGVQVGYMIPWQVRRVGQATTCTVNAVTPVRT